MAYRYARAVTRMCPECGDNFSTHTPFKLTCSDECARRRKTRKQRAERDARMVEANKRAAAWYAARRAKEKD